MMMLTTKEAIEKRRSIRKFKNDEVTDEIINELIEAARLAPSGCNAQPWRFKIVKDQSIKNSLAEAAYDQKFISEAPVVIVCCADIKGYLEGRVSGVQDLGKICALEERIVTIILKNAEKAEMKDIGPLISFNAAIAIEHIVLRALDFGLGTCWIRLLEEEKVKKTFGWDDNIYVVALLPVGYPEFIPEPRKRLPLEDILL